MRFDEEEHTFLLTSLRRLPSRGVFTVNAKEVPFRVDECVQNSWTPPSFPNEKGSFRKRDLSSQDDG